MNWLRKIINFICTPCRRNNSTTVRLAFPFMLAAATFLGAQAIVSTNASFITLTPSTNSLKAGEPFSIDVFVTAQQEINAVDLDIKFPRDQMQITGIDTGESVITLWTEDPYFENGTVYLRGGTFRRGFKGQHQIVTIKARAVETGIAEIIVADPILLAGDGAGTKVAIADTDKDRAKIFIADENGDFSPALAREMTTTLRSSAEIVIVTDIDGDGDVGLADVSRFMSAWFTRDTVFDFNGDGRMTFRDFGIILSDSFFK